jgi:hypothetical protein
VAEPPPIALETRAAQERRLFSPSAARNREPIVAAFAPFLPKAGKALEVASGTGEHVIALARATPAIVWRPSDLDAASRDSVAAWTAHEGLANVLAPIAVDAAADAWGVEAEAPFDALVCINMIHIAPWEAGLGLFAGASRLLRANGVVLLYGPFLTGEGDAPSNLAFDDSLKRRDPRWGVRALAAVTEAAHAQGLAREAVLDMPANNLVLAFRKR